MQNCKIEISCIVTSYYEERSINEFVNRLNKALGKEFNNYEIIIVNDGSTDSTFNEIQKLYNELDSISTIIDLTHNSGQAAAITAGLQHVKGESVLFIDSDLQLDPEEVGKLNKLYIEKDAEIVSGIRKNRQDPVRRKLFSFIAYTLMRKMTNYKISDFGCTFKMINANFLKSFNFSPSNIYNHIEIINFSNRVFEVPITHNQRKFGKSGWTFKKLLSFFVQSLLNTGRQAFQNLLILLSCLMGLIVVRIMFAFVSDFSLLSNISNGLIFYMNTIFFFITLVLILVIGEYLVHVMRYVRSSPNYVVRTVLEKKLVTDE